MNAVQKKQYATNGEEVAPWTVPTTTPLNVSEETASKWRALLAKVFAIAKDSDWTRAELARRTGIPGGTLYPLIEGTYTGNYFNQLEKLQAWLDNHQEVRERLVTLPEEPGFFETPTSRELTETLMYAQELPQIVVATLAAGLGKTTTARQFRNRPGVSLATMRPTTSKTFGMLQEVAVALDVTERSATRIDRAIGAKLKRNGRRTLLIIDEAQNLCDQAVDQLRFFYDEYRCGIALLGNEEIYARYGKGETREGFGQIHRRIGKRIRRMKPAKGDIEATIDAWGVEDPEARRLLAAIGLKPGTLGQIAETTKLAMMIAVGNGEPLAYKHVRQAWSNRSGEEVRP